VRRLRRNCEIPERKIIDQICQNEEAGNQRAPCFFQSLRWAPPFFSSNSFWGGEEECDVLASIIRLLIS
jgi:hypothetical protein